MPSNGLSEDARKATEHIRRADIVVGIPSYNNGRTIGHVIRAVHAGLARYFPQLAAVIVNSDEGPGTGHGTRLFRRKSRTGNYCSSPRLLLLRTACRCPITGFPAKGSRSA